MTLTQTNNNLPVEGLLKIDAYGRRMYKKEFRENLLDAFESSSMSGANFAKEHGVRPQTLATWIQRRRQKQGGSVPQQKDSTRSLTLVSVAVEEASIPTVSLDLRLPGGVSVKLESEQQVPLLKSLLKELSC